MASVKVIDIPLTREHAETILKSLHFYKEFHTSNDWDYPGDKIVDEEIEYIRAIIKFYEAAEVLNGN